MTISNEELNLENITKEVEKENEKKTPFYYVAFVLIIISGILFFGLLIYYFYTGLIYKIEVKETAEAIVSLPAFFATIAGLFFVVDNLILQRKSLIKQYEDIAHQRIELKSSIKEAKDSNAHYETQNQIMRLQQADNTFFNLLEHNKRLYDQLEFDLGHFYTLNNHFEISTKFYTDSMNNLLFHSSRDTRMYPKDRLLDDGIKDSKTETFIKNIADIVEYIEINFKESNKTSFYHKIFFNNMSIDLKIFLGICIDYKLFNINISESLIYSDEYKNKLNLYKSTKLAFPIFRLTRKPTVSNGEWEFRNYMNTDFVFDIIEFVKPTKDFILRGFKILAFNHHNNEMIYDNRVTLVNEDITSKNSFNIPFKEVIERARYTTSGNAVKGYLVLVLYIEFEKDNYKVFEDFEMSYYYQNGNLLVLNLNTAQSVYHQKPEILQNIGLGETS